MQYQDTRNFLSKLSLRKLTNAAAVLGSYYASKWSGKAVHRGMPFNLSVEPTTDCNLGCPECPSGLKSFTRPTGRLSMELYQKTVDELRDELIYLYFYFQGEPYLHPQFTELVRYASERNIYTVTSTNAHFLTPRKAEETVHSRLDRILISIDGTTQDVYEQYRVGGSLQKVLDGTRNLVAAKRSIGSKTPHIVFQFLVVKPNEHQIPAVKKMAAELGVDEVKLKTAQIYDFENGSDLMPSTDRYSRYRKMANGKYKIKNALHNHCWKMWHSSVMTWDGRIVPCCFDKDAQHQMGDVSKQSFLEVWKSKPYQRFRNSVLESRRSIDICTNCSEGTTVWAPD